MKNLFSWNCVTKELRRFIITKLRKLIIFLNYLYLIDFANREIPLRKIRSNNNRGKLRFAMNQTIFLLGSIFI